MALTNEQLVHQMYIAYYQRPADPDGLAYWVNQIEENGSWEAVAGAFGAPENEEYQGLYGDKSRADLIAELYQSAFGRVADQEEIDFWVASEHSDMNLGFAIISGAQNDDKALIENKVAFSELLAAEVDQAGYVALTDVKDLLVAVTADTEVTAEYVAGVVANAGGPSDLAEALEALEAARDQQVEATEALVEKLVKTGIDTEATEANFSAAAFDAYKLEAEQNVLNAKKELNEARTEVSDAQLQQAVNGAQAVIDTAALRFNNDGQQLELAEGKLVNVYQYGDQFTIEPEQDGVAGTPVGYQLVGVEANDGYSPTADGAYTAKQLQSLAATAVAQYGASVASQGETKTLVAALKDAVALYEAAGGADVPDALVDALEEYDPKANADLYFAISNVKLYDEDESVLNGDEARADAVAAAFDAVAARAEAGLKVADTKAAFSEAEGVVFADDTSNPDGLATLTGAEGALAVREALIDAVATAEDDAVEIASLIEAYQAAVASVSAAAEEVGAEVEYVDEAAEIATDEADLFIVDFEALDEKELTAVNLLDLATGDQIYIGSAFVQATPATADNNAIEVFIKGEAGNTTVTLETEAYGSNTGDVITLTLVGVDAEQVSFEEGLLSIA